MGNSILCSDTCACNLKLDLKDVDTSYLVTVDQGPRLLQDGEPTLDEPQLD